MMGIRRRARVGICLGGLIALVALGPSAANAAQVRFGSDLAPAADGVPSPCPGGSPCEMLGRHFHPTNLWPEASPIAGVVTQFLTRSSAQDTITFKLARQTSTPGQYTHVATGPLLDLAGNNTVQSVPARIAVGDFVSLRDPTSPAYSAVSASRAPRSCSPRR